jgi:hypothetical protein
MVGFSCGGEAAENDFGWWVVDGGLVAIGGELMAT